MWRITGDVTAWDDGLGIRTLLTFPHTDVAEVTRRLQEAASEKP